MIWGGNLRQRTTQSSIDDLGLCVVDGAHFLTGVARLIATVKLIGPYEACITAYGSDHHAAKVVVTVVDRKRRFVLDHRMWLMSEYREEFSRCVESVLKALTVDMMEYCERSSVGKVFILHNMFPTKDLVTNYHGVSVNGCFCAEMKNHTCFLTCSRILASFDESSRVCELTESVR